MAGNEVWLALTGGTPSLTNEQKAILWQLQANGKKNPYDQDIGDYIYQLDKERKSSAANGEEAPKSTAQEQTENDGMDFSRLIAAQWG